MSVPEPILRHALLVERGLRSVFDQESFPLYHLMEYQLGWRDEYGAPMDFPVPQTRLYAAMCLLACEATGGDLDQALPAATALELLYQFIQVHSDVQEGSQERHNRHAVWWVWGPAQAINVGDGLHALGRLALMRVKERNVDPEETLRLLAILDGAALRTFEGMHQDMVYQERIDITIDAYLKMAREKSGALMGCALELGASAGGASLSKGQTFRQFGEDLGLAFHVQEDIQMLWGEPLSGKAKGTDLLNKKKGFPVLQALDQAPISQKRELGTLFMKRVLELPDLEQLTAILEGHNARANAQDKAGEICNVALSHLQDTGLPTSAMEDLRQVAHWLALREGMS